jgi:hypothetical protein
MRNTFDAPVGNGSARIRAPQLSHSQPSSKRTTRIAHSLRLYAGDPPRDDGIRQERPVFVKSVPPTRISIRFATISDVLTNAIVRRKHKEHTRLQVPAISEGRSRGTRERRIRRATSEDRVRARSDPDPRSERCQPAARPRASPTSVLTRSERA